MLEINIIFGLNMRTCSFKAQWLVKLQRFLNGVEIWAIFKKTKVPLKNSLWWSPWNLIFILAQFERANWENTEHLDGLVKTTTDLLCRRCLTIINNQLLPTLQNTRLNSWYVHFYKAVHRQSQKGLLKWPEYLEKFKWHLLWLQILCSRLQWWQHQGLTPVSEGASPEGLEMLALPS